MFTEEFFTHHHLFFCKEDIWLKTLLRLHVSSEFTNDREFKVQSILKLRQSSVYKTLKLSAETVETNLLHDSSVSLVSFVALASLYNVNVAVVTGNLCIFTKNSEPSHFVDVSGSIRPIPASKFEELYRILLVGKPLNALSYYTVSDLETITRKLRLPKGSKSLMYNGIQHYIHSKITALPAKTKKN
jgi:hypothetical protein